MHLPIVGTNFALSSVVCSCHKKQQQTNKPRIPPRLHATLLSVDANCARPG